MSDFQIEQYLKKLDTQLSIIQQMLQEVITKLNITDAKEEN